MAPTYANICLRNFEKCLLDNCTDKPFLYLRYIGDIYAIWQCSEDKLEQFREYVNSIHPIIKLTLTLSAINISHLDISVSFDDTKIHTSIYRISTGRHGYLHYKSFHPKRIKNGMVYSQFIRNRRICSNKLTFEHQSSNIFQHFRSKDYPFKLIHNGFRKVCHLVRCNLLKYSHKTDTNDIPKIHDFDPSIQKFSQDIKNVW